LGAGLGSVAARRLQKRQAKFDWIDSGSVREFIEEGLKHPSITIAAVEMSEAVFRFHRRVR
jgi:hypothetical protein